MPVDQYTQVEYAVQRVVQTFSNFLFELVEHHLTHTYIVVFGFCQLENIDYLLLSFLNTGRLTFEEFSKQWMFDDKVESLSISETVSGTVSIWQGWRMQRES
jgi:hypothetical protein